MHEDRGLGKKVFLAATALYFSIGWSIAHAESDKYRLSWTDEPATTMTIGWSQVSGTAEGVKWGTDPELNTFDSKAFDIARTYDNTLHPEGPALDSYFADLTGLLPDTTYYFRTYDSNGDNEIYWFKTAPDTPQPVTFISGGDSRTNTEPRQWGNQLVSKIRPLFVAFGGDYHDDVTNDEMRQWLDDWQMTVSSDGRMYPIIPAHGNHENDMTDFVQLMFNMDNPDAYYAANVGGDMMRLYSLNSELEPGVGYGAFSGQDVTKWNKQTDWLAADMAANPGYTWKVGQFHRPMRPHQGGKPEGIGRIDAWAQTMYDNGMDLVIDCDSHMMKYTYPVAPSTATGSYESFVRDDANGTMFIGEGSWGAPHRANDDDKPWTLSSETGWQFKLIHVDPDNIDIRTVRFGQYNEQGNPELGYEMDGIVELPQSTQDSEPFAMPDGLNNILWKPLAGEVVTLFSAGDLFSGADVENVEYVTTGDQWRYLDDGTDQGTEWRNPGFDHTSWAMGDAQLGYGDGDETTVIGFGTNPDDKNITAYFRKEFEVSVAADVLKLKAMLLRDDGAVVYINGTEAVRSSMPDGDVTYTTRANDAGDENRYYEYHLDPSLLVDGLNTIAVEVHQSGPTSSDTSFDMVLFGIETNVLGGTTPGAPTLLTEVSSTTTTIDIGWTDNASDEVGYELWRKVADGTWEIYEPSLAADTDGFSDIMLAEGTAYSYKVRAYNAVGLSEFTDEVTINTPVASTPLIYGEDFNTGTFNLFTTVDVASDKGWLPSEYPSGSGEWFARMNGYGADAASDDWFISPKLNLYAYAGEYVKADLAYNYGGPEIEVLVSDNYDSSVHNDPSEAHWRALPAAMPSTGGYSFETTGELRLDLAAVNFDDDTFGSFSTYSVASDAEWIIETRADKLGAIANGFGADSPSDDWLISPALSVGAGSEIEVSFNLYRKYGGPELEVMVSSDYTGTGDPTAATWSSYTIAHEDIYDAWKYVSITHEFANEANAYVAFRYTSTGTGPGDGARLGVDDVVIQPTSAQIGFHYISTGTGGGDGRIWEVDNFEFRGNRVSYTSEDFNEDLIADTGFTAFSGASDADWIIEERAGQKGAVANGFGADGASDDWLISPAMIIDPNECAEVTFDFYHKYGGPELQVMISNDYDGTSDPTDGTSNWDAVTVPFDGDYYDAWKPVNVDLCNYSGTVNIAFRYTSTGTGPGEGARIGIDNVSVIRKVITEFSVDFSANYELVTNEEPVDFTSYVSGGSSPYTYLWTFGDGLTSTESSPSLIFSNAGVYSVSLLVTDDKGEELSVDKPDLITVVNTIDDAVVEMVGDVRIASFNAYLNRSQEGEILEDLKSGDNEQIKKVAEIIQRVNPDILLLNEFDYVEDGSAVDLFMQNYLEVPQADDVEPIYFRNYFLAESNTGIPSGVDLDNNGSIGGPNDAFGYGEFPGQYGMVLFSKYKIKGKKIRTFQNFLWQDMHNNSMPEGYYSDEAVEVFRLSSKSHWDVPVKVGDKVIHVLCSHPTPPVFDDEIIDQNGRRNHDEIKFWADYVNPKLGYYIYDDDGKYGGIGVKAKSKRQARKKAWKKDDKGKDKIFVILGDQNADPDEGDSYDNAILQLTEDKKVDASCVPESDGAYNENGAADDTASWGLRADYVLPSEFGVTGEQCGVYWPTWNDVNYDLVEDDASSDHRLVWHDLSFFMRGDLNGDSHVDRRDIRILWRNLRQPAADCPECDLNGDGWVSFKDIREITKLCTLPRCATQHRGW